MVVDEETNENKAEVTQVMVRLSPDEKKRIKALIDEGRFTTYANFCRTAIFEKLNREEYAARFHESLMDDFDNPETRKRFRRILSEILSTSIESER